MPTPDQQWAFFQSQSDRIEAKEKEITMKEREISILKMKYAWMKILLESQGITTSDMSRSVCISSASGSSDRRVRSKLDASSSEGSALGQWEIQGEGPLFIDVSF